MENNAREITMEEIIEAFWAAPPEIQAEVLRLLGFEE